jgi:hypothetical protein
MKPTRTVPALFVALVVASCGDPEAETAGADKATSTTSLAVTRATRFTSPYVGSGVTAIAGRLTIDGNSWLVFWRTTDAHCTWHRLGTPALTNGVGIEVDSAAFAEVQILAPFQRKGVFCSNLNQTFTFDRPVLQGLFTVSASGSPGADYFNCTGSGRTVCVGNAGNDILESFDDDTELFGGDGDDKLRFWSQTSSKSTLFGEAGTDCLQLFSAPTALGAYDCGPGLDRSTHQLGVGCELQAPLGSCNRLWVTSH